LSSEAVKIGGKAGTLIFEVKEKRGHDKANRNHDQQEGQGSRY